MRICTLIVELTPFGLNDCSASKLDKKVDEVWDTLPARKNKNITIVAVGKDKRGQLYVTTSGKYTPKARSLICLVFDILFESHSNYNNVVISIF